MRDFHGKFFRELGPEDGWYRVGPLTRVTQCDFIPTPFADHERRDFMAFGSGKPDGTVSGATLG